VTLTRRPYPSGYREAVARCREVHVPRDYPHRRPESPGARMLEAVGSKALKLVRTAIGPVRIGDLPIGKHRLLTEAEIRQLSLRK